MLKLVSNEHPKEAARACFIINATDRVAPFLAGAKLPSRDVSSHFSNPSASNAPNRTRRAFSHTPSSCHCFSRRQQVAGEGNPLERDRHATPVYRIHRMPSKQPRFDTHGRPRLSFLRRGSGNNGSINSQFSSLNSFCRLFTTEAQRSAPSCVSI